jgi:branched-chain amino acid transport system substrate-binding protein
LGSAIVSEARSRRVLDDTDLATNDALFFQGFVDDLGDHAEGMLFGVSDNSFTKSGKYRKFARAYLKEFGEEPLEFFSAHAFDATNMILDAIETVGVVDGDQTLHIGRQALRNALFATDGLAGLTGTITCDAFGDCGATGFLIFTVKKGKFVPLR